MDLNFPHPDRDNRRVTRLPIRSGWRNLWGAFNLNDPRWGRGDDADREGKNEGNEGGNRPDDEANRPNRDQRPTRGQGPNQGPPDLDELWRDFNRKLGGLFGGKGGGGSGGRGGGSGGGGLPSFNPSPKTTGIGAGLIAGVAALIWLGTGFFIVQEGQQAVITQFGKYHSTVGAGFNWRLPFPVQRHETVFVTQIRSVDVGRDNIVPATGLRESAHADRRREHRGDQVCGAVPPERRPGLPF